MKRLLKELKRPAGMLELFDSLYEEIKKDAKIPDEEKLESFKNQISTYMGGPKAPRGSSRMVFPLSDRLVVKVALNEAGFVQNGMEATIGQDDEVADVVVPVESSSNIIDHGGYLWIASKRVEPLNENAVGKDWSIFRQALIDASEKSGPVAPSYPVNDLASTVPAPGDIPTVVVGKNKKRDEKKSIVLQSEVYKNLPQSFFESFRKFTKRYSKAKTADLLKPDSWGIDDNTIKLIDYGYTSTISKDYYVKTPRGSIPAPSAEIQQRLAVREKERTQNIETTLSDNVDTIKNIKKPIPPMMTLLLVLRGIIVGLPLGVETFAIGNPLPPLTPTELISASETVRSNLSKIDEIIEKIADASVRKTAEDELDDFLVMKGKVGESYSHKLIKKFILESVMQYKKRAML